jgi:hypothetical protein
LAPCDHPNAAYLEKRPGCGITNGILLGLFRSVRVSWRFLLGMTLLFGSLVVGSHDAAQADDGWFPVDLTCAKEVGPMRDGTLVYSGAAAQAYSLPYPWGTVLELRDGTRWTIEDTLAPRVPHLTSSGERFDLYRSGDRESCLAFGHQRTQARIVRMGWERVWLGPHTGGSHSFTSVALRTRSGAPQRDIPRLPEVSL